MEGGDGMVAVVRGLPDAGLALTLLEGCRRYTLIPNSVPQHSMPSCVHVTRDIPESMPNSTEVCPEPAMRCDSSAQATDGHYASMYKMTHCNISPTSPPAHLTEFPPQRAELCPGHGNFEVGGSGSGEKYSPVRQTTRFRGGMSWPDRGSVCAPRPSYEPDAFANSLRKYPSMSPQRSAEIVERLVNYTQAKHANKSPTRSRMSPSRLSESNSSHTLDKEYRGLSTRPRCYEPEVNIRPRVKTDESPTREGRPKRCDILCPEMNASDFCRNYEVRCLRDISKRTRDSLKCLAGQPNYQPCCWKGMTKYSSCLDAPQGLSRRKATESNTTSVNMEIQAVVETVSKEVAALPCINPSKRNVAVPLSPLPSITQRYPEISHAATGFAYKSVQTIPNNGPTKTRKSVQITTSSIELLSVVDKWQYNEHSRRKSKSEEELRTRKDDFRKEILQLLQSIDCHGDEVCQAFRDELVKQIKRTRRRLHVGIDGRAKSAPFWFKTNCRRCIDNCRRVKKNDVYTVETRSPSVPSDDSLQNAVKDWLHEINTKNSEFLDQNSLDQVVSSLTAKLRNLCLSSEQISKSEIMQLIEEVTFDASDSDKNVQLKNLVEALCNKIKDVLHSNARKNNKYRPSKENTPNKNKYFPFKNLIQPTEDEVRNFVREELFVFMDKFHFKFISRNKCDVETKLINVLVDSIGELQWDNNEKVKEDVEIVLRETSKIPEYYLTYLAHDLVQQFKRFISDFNGHNAQLIEQQTFFVLQNTVQNTSIQPNDITNISIEPVTEADVEAQIERYTSQLTQVIEEWWTNILGTDENEKGFKDVAINDLAGDIVDRHRFLDMNTSKPSSDEDEVEYLKFQIFRWINKLVGDQGMQQAIDKAPELMERIQIIPVPVMRMPEGQLQSQNIGERSRSPAAARNNTPGIAQAANPDYTSSAKQMPKFGPPGQDKSIFEDSRKHAAAAATSRRISESAAYSVPRMVASPGPGGSSRSPQSRRHSVPANVSNPTGNLSRTGLSIPQLTNEFQNYLQDWVNQIPIAAQDKNFIEKLRRGIYNGVLMALAKAEIDSATLRNDFYLQDFLEEKLEELLSCLPSSPELESKKVLLKAKLIERATQKTKAIKVVNTSTSYRFRLWDAITSTLPPRPIVDDRDKSNAHLFEEFLKLNIAEDYLLNKLYRDMNLPKANAHKEKVLISLQQLYDNAKLMPGGDRIAAVEYNSFATTMYNAIINVNSPPRDVMQDEGDQIILSHEISQWLQELPIAHSYEYSDQLQRRILRDSLAKRIHEIEKQTNLRDDASVRQVKNELSKFLGMFSLPPEEAGNLSFLIDEFTNKLKNRRERVQAPVDFPWFFMNVPFSSSFVEHSRPIDLQERLEDDCNILEPPGRNGGSRMLGVEPVLQSSPYKEPSDAQWLTLLNIQEQLQRDREVQALAAQQKVPSCCQPTAAPIIQPMPYPEPSNIEWLTLLNTQEQLEREKEALGAQSQIPPCCQPAASVAASQRRYSENGPGVLFAPIIGADARSLHTSHITGANYQPIVSPGRQVGAPAAAPSMHSEIRRLVDLQDTRLSMMQGANPAARPGPSGVTSFIQPPAPPIVQMPATIFNTGQIVGPSGVPRRLPAEPSDPCTRATPMAHGSVRPRRFGSPQQVMSGGSPSNQSQFEFAAPLAQPEAVFANRHDLEDIPQQNISRPMQSPLDWSVQAPVGFSTPRRSLAGRVGAPEGADVGNVPGAPRVRRKRTREGEAARPDARRRLDVDEVEEEEERERDEVQCRCTERMYRCRRRRPMCCDCDDMDYPRYYPMPYPHCFF